MENQFLAMTAATVEDVLANQCSCPQNLSSVEDIIQHPGCPEVVEDIDDIVGALDYNQPSGKHICELEDTSRVFKNDLLIVSQLSGSTWTSRKVAFTDFKRQLLKDLAAGLNLGTMAYEDKSHWALTSHNHNAAYNKVEWHPNPEYRRGEVSCLAMIHISTETLTAMDIYHNPKDSAVVVEDLSVNCPVFQSPVPPEPPIGTLRFVSVPTLQKLIDGNQLNVNGTQVDPYDSNNRIRTDFDGWVFPNGTSIPNYNSQLSDAAFVFANSKSIESFTVPTLSSFFQSCGVTDGYTIAEQPQVIGLARHEHGTSTVTLTCDVEFDSEKTVISSTKGCSGDAYVHHGGDGDTSTQEASIKLPVEFNDTIRDLATKTAGDASSEEYCPAHNLIPVMIYIGGVLKDHYASIS